MTTLPERESAFEAKFAHDEEARFLVMARRDKLFAGWVADHLDLDGPTRAGLVASVLAVGNDARHDELLLGIAERILVAQGRPVIRVDLVAALVGCAGQAQRSIGGSTTG